MKHINGQKVKLRFRRRVEGQCRTTGRMSRNVPALAGQVPRVVPRVEYDIRTDPVFRADMKKVILECVNNPVEYDNTMLLYNDLYKEGTKDEKKKYKIILDYMKKVSTDNKKIKNFITNQFKLAKEVYDAIKQKAGTRYSIHLLMSAETERLDAIRRAPSVEEEFEVFPDNADEDPQ
jgi:hypothetical protein